MSSLSVTLIIKELKTLLADKIIKRASVVREIKDLTRIGKISQASQLASDIEAIQAPIDALEASIKMWEGSC